MIPAILECDVEEAFPTVVDGLVRFLIVENSTVAFLMVVNGPVTFSVVVGSPVAFPIVVVDSPVVSGVSWGWGITGLRSQGAAELQRTHKQTHTSNRIHAPSAVTGACWELYFFGNKVISCKVGI